MKTYDTVTAAAVTANMLRETEVERRTYHLVDNGNDTWSIAVADGGGRFVKYHGEVVIALELAGVI